MSAETTTLDASPIRVWRATEKRMKNLKRWASMPLRQIAPPNRPLFKCSTCGFVNTRGALCLQCTRAGCIRMAIQNGALKRRRVSAPQPLNDVQKEQLRRIQQKTSGAGTLYKPTQEQDSQKVNAFALYPAETRTIRRKRHRDAAVLSVHDVAAAAHLSPEANFYVRSIIVSRSQHVEVSPPSSPFITESREPNTAALEDQKTPVCTPALGSQRTLRRKKRFSLSRQRSVGASLRSRSGFRLSNFAVSEPVPPTPLNSPQAPSQPGYPAPTPLPMMERILGAVPLGHPTRPFYTAIRRVSPYNTLAMADGNVPSRASTPASETTIVHPRARSLDLQPSMDFGEGEDHISRYFSRPYAVDLSSGAVTGCSFSGEIELRMALARRNTIGGSAAHPEYRFEYPQIATKESVGTQKRGSGVKLRVKKIGQGLKNFVLLRRPTSPVLA